MTFHFVRVGDKTTHRAVGFWVGFILQAVLVCVTACLGQPAEAEGSPGNALCELQGPPWTLALGEGGESPTAECFGRLSNEEMRECLPVASTETFLGWGRDQR